MNYSALVTGGTGFVGTNLVRSLLKKEWNVDVIVRRSSNTRVLSDCLNPTSIHFHDGSMTNMSEIIANISPDVVFHTASMVVTNEHSPEQLESILSSNIIFGSQLLEAMKENGISKIINTGTYWEHYENNAYSPVNFYAATKYAFQAILQYYTELQYVNAVTLKLFDLYGSDDPRPKLLNLLVATQKSGKSLSMSAGEQKISLIHIDDVVNAYEISAQRLINNNVQNHEVYGISSERTITLKELVNMIEKITRKKINIKWGARPYRKREVMEPWNHYDRLPTWSPKVSINTGLMSFLENDNENSGVDNNLSL